VRRWQVNLSAVVEVSAQQLADVSAGISARVAQGEPVPDWIDPHMVAALALLGLDVDLGTGALRRGDGAPVQALRAGISQP